MNLTFVGGLAVTVSEIIKSSAGGGEARPVCAGTVGASDPAVKSYLFQTDLGDDRLILSFVVHRTGAAGTYAIGDYPDGSKDAPAAVNVLLFRVGPGEGFATWNSGSGNLVVDPGGRSGSLTASLGFVGWRTLPQKPNSPLPTALPGLQVSGTWVCPDGS